LVKDKTKFEKIKQKFEKIINLESDIATMKTDLSQEAPRYSELFTKLIEMEDAVALIGEIINESIGMDQSLKLEKELIELNKVYSSQIFNRLLELILSDSDSTNTSPDSQSRESLIVELGSILKEQNQRDEILFFQNGKIPNFWINKFVEKFEDFIMGFGLTLFNLIIINLI